MKSVIPFQICVYPASIQHLHTAAPTRKLHASPKLALTVYRTSRLQSAATQTKRSRLAYFPTHQSCERPRRTYVQSIRPLFPIQPCHIITPIRGPLQQGRRACTPSGQRGKENRVASWRTRGGENETHLQMYHTVMKQEVDETRGDKAKRRV